MLILLTIFIFLFISTATAFFFFFRAVKRNTSHMKIDLDKLVEGLTSLKEGNLAKEIETDKRLQKSSNVSKHLTSIGNELELATTEFNHITEKPLKRLCYIGADSYLEGRVCGQKMAEIINGEGEVGIVQIKFDLTGTVLRQKGFSHVCSKKYPGIRIVEVTDTYGNPDMTYQCVKSWIEKYPNLKGIYIVEGITPPAAAKAVMEANKDIKIIGHDIEEEISECISKKMIHASVSQNLFSQGYNPVIALFNSISSGWKPDRPRQLVNMDIITPENLYDFWEPGKGLVVSDDIRKDLIQPKEKASKKIRIMVSGDERYPIYLQIKKGVLEAKKVLEQYNAEVVWVVPEPYKEKNAQIISHKEMFEFLRSNMAKGYDGLSLMVNYAEYTPLLNSFIDKGKNRSLPLTVNLWGSEGL